MSSHDRSKGISRANFLKGTLAAGMALTAAPLLRAGPAFAAASSPLNEKPIPKSKTGEKLPVIGLGTRAMSKSDTKAVSGQSDVIHTLLSQGGKVIDTAANYAGGDSEEVIGEVLKAGNLRSKAFLATKFAERGKENGVRSIENSLKVLNTDQLDLMYIHNMVDIPTQLPVIEDYKARGKFRYIGISDTSDNQDELIKYLDRLDFIEFAYAADGREAENRLLPAALDKGVACFIALPLGRGRALKAVQGKEVPEWAKQELGAETFAQLLLKFVVSHPAVTTAIPSTLQAKHMTENLNAGRGVIPDAKQRERIAAIWENA
jgi:aryl-alcohol dehydrogenase-like predicted oxidoreductase